MLDETGEFDHQVRALTRRLARCPRNGRGRAISQGLWAEAADLAARHGVYRTARALGLNYISLKKRISQTSAVVEAGPAFLEWLPGLTNTAAECVLEVTGPQGTRVRVEIKNIAPQGIAALIRGLAG